jgi:hypothetical protein
VVSFVNVSCRQDVPLPANWNVAADRLVIGGPLYPVADITALLDKGVVATSLFTDDCKLDVAFEGWSLKNVVQLVQEALQYGKYKNSQWCRQGVTDELVVPCAPCDAYAVRFIHAEKGPTNYYVKFAISKTGKLLLIFSCHS